MKTRVVFIIFISLLRSSVERSIKQFKKVDNFVEYRLVYLNGKIYTVDVENEPSWDTTPAQAIVIDDGVIEYVGNDKEAEEYIYETGYATDLVVYNLHGSVVLPGFHDIHMHPLEAQSPVAGTCILPSETDPDDEQIKRILEECPPKQIGIDWVLGWGHSITNLLDYVRRNDSRSPREILDDYIDRPAVMMEQTSHSMWVNSAALKLAGINESTPERPGGIIMREKDSNKPNGILFENEGMAIMERALKPDETLRQLNYDGLIYALKLLYKNGITSMCDARLFWKIDHHKAWEQACQNGKLHVRAVQGLWAYPLMDDKEQIQKLKELYTNGLPGCSLRRTQIKLYSDGITDSTTAAVLEPYLINLHLPGMGDSNNGINYFDQDRLQKYISELQNFEGGKGFDFHIHAIGDRGIQESLNAIENAQNADSSLRKPRHRLTHLEVVAPTDVPRFKDLGVIADFQVAGEFTLPHNHVWLKELIGKKRADFSIPVKSVVDTGAKATFSSDWDVSDLNPFYGIQHATQRGDQSVSVKTAIEMYTINPAYAMRQEDVVGSLIKGKEADLVVLDKDILNIAHLTINKTVVLQTVFKGEEIFRHRYFDHYVSDESWWYWW